MFYKNSKNTNCVIEKKSRVSYKFINLFPYCINSIYNKPKQHNQTEQKHKKQQKHKPK